MISAFRQDVRDPNGIQMKRNGIESAEELEDTIVQFSRQSDSASREMKESLIPIGMARHVRSEEVHGIPSDENQPRKK